MGDRDQFTVYSAGCGFESHGAYQIWHCASLDRDPEKGDARRR